MSWLHVNATVVEAERLLKTEYFVYEHAVTGVPQIACHEYHLPDHISRHVDFITPTVHFDTPLNIKHRRSMPPSSYNNPHKVHKRTIRKRKIRTLAEAERVDSLDNKDQIARIRPGHAAEVGTLTGFRPKPGATLADNAGIQQLEDCDEQITPACLRALYGYAEPKGTPNPKNSYGYVL
jgi:tripeptidyl-peptidase-1